MDATTRRLLRLAVDRAQRRRMALDARVATLPVDPRFVSAHPERVRPMLRRARLDAAYAARHADDGEQPRAEHTASERIVTAALTATEREAD